MVEKTEGEMFKEDLLHYKKYNDFILVLMLLLIALYIYAIVRVSKDKDVTNIIEIASFILFILIYVIASKRIYKNQLEAYSLECLGIETTASSIITADNKFKAAFTFVYFYILTFFSTLIWGVVFFLVMYIVFCSLYSVYMKRDFDYIINSKFEFTYLWSIWSIFKFISIILSFVTAVLIIWVVIPLKTVKPGINEILDFVRKGFNDNSLNLIIFVAIISFIGYFFFIERISHTILKTNFFKKVFNNIGMVKIFSAFKPVSNNFYHLPIFFLGILIAFIYGFINLPVVKNIHDCSIEDRQKFMKIFTNGFFFLTVTTVIIYLLSFFTRMIM